jgi:hypothetical protein
MAPEGMCFLWESIYEILRDSYLKCENSKKKQHIRVANIFNTAYQAFDAASRLQCDIHDDADDVDDVSGVSDISGISDDDDDICDTAFVAGHLVPTYVHNLDSDSDFDKPNFDDQSELDQFRME